MGSLSTGLAFLRPHFEGPELVGPLGRARLSPYQLTHHITDMYHHRCFRGARRAVWRFLDEHRAGAKRMRFVQLLEKRRAGAKRMRLVQF